MGVDDSSSSAGMRTFRNDPESWWALPLVRAKAQPGDAMAFANQPASITVNGQSFARLAGSVARLAGGPLA